MEAGLIKDKSISFNQTKKHMNGFMRLKIFHYFIVRVKLTASYGASSKFISKSFSS